MCCTAYAYNYQKKIHNLETPGKNIPAERRQREKQRAYKKDIRDNAHKIRLKVRQQTIIAFYPLRRNSRNDLMPENREAHAHSIRIGRASITND